MASWSYAFRRMRILFAVIADICPYRADGAPPRSWGAAPVVCPFRFSRGTAAGPISGPAPYGPAPEPLLENLADDPRAYSATPFADREPKALVHGDRLDQLDRHLDVVPRHHHLRAL